MPEGFEIHETVNGQVFLRRQRPRLIREAEIAAVERGLEQARSRNLYQLETREATLTIHEGQDSFSELVKAFSWGRSPKQAELRERFAQYQPVMRFILVDEEKRLFAPERYCFRGSVDDWIPIGPPELIKKLAAKYFKHLGRESFFELY